MIIKFEELEKIREGHKNETIVFAGGCFDLPHAGHVLFVEEAKKYGNLLVVQIASDEEVRQKKGEGRPIFNQEMRIKIIDSLKPVDYSFVEKFISDAGHPLEAKNDILKNLKPDVYIVNKDSSDIGYLEKITKKYNVKLIVLDRYCPPEFADVSTSEIVRKITGESK